MNDDAAERMERPEPSLQRLFEDLVDEMTRLLGGAATAVIVRRAAKRASAQHPEIASLVVRKDGVHYVFDVPDAWRTGDVAHREGFRAFVVELRAIASDLTGAVLVRTLDRIPGLAAVLSTSEHDA